MVDETETTQPVLVKPFEQRWRGMTLFVESARVWGGEAEVTLWEGGALYRFRATGDAGGVVVRMTIDPGTAGRRRILVRDWARAFLRERIARLERGRDRPEQLIVPGLGES
jgi:hemin uptake protein HemP